MKKKKLTFLNWVQIKKKGTFAYLRWRIFKKKLNQNIDADKLCGVVAEFVVGGCIVLRLGGGLFVVKQNA